MTDLQTASYLLINGFHWYLYRRLLTLFLGQRRVGCPAEAAGYLCAYVLNSLCFLLVGVPLLNLASSLLPCCCSPCSTVLRIGKGCGLRWSSTPPAFCWIHWSFC